MRKVRDAGLLVEHRDGACHSYNNQGLAGKEGEDHGAEDRGEENFVYSVLHLCLCEHVERKSEGWEDTRS